MAVWDSHLGRPTAARENSPRARDPGGEAQQEYSFSHTVLAGQRGESEDSDVFDACYSRTLLLCSAYKGPQNKYKLNPLRPRHDHQRQLQDRQTDVSVEGGKRGSVCFEGRSVWKELTSDLGGFVRLIRR